MEPSEELSFVGQDVVTTDIEVTGAARVNILSTPLVPAG